MNLDNLDIEALKTVLSSSSSLDSGNFIGPFHTKEESYKFFKSYGFNLDDPVERAEFFGIFQEAIQFIKRFFLKPGNEEGLDLEVPNLFYSLTDIADLSLIAAGSYEGQKITEAESIWATAIIKVMHTILHADKDLRYHYFTTIQMQVFDRFYKYLHRDDQDRLFLQIKGKESIPLVNFETKANKSRESTIIKLLHKKENVAEELFDRIGVRFITHNKIDILRVINFLKVNHVIIYNNVKPSRSVNTIFDVKDLDNPSELTEEKLNQLSIFDSDNAHTSQNYRAVHFTCRQLIKYQNPFLKQLNSIRQLARKEKDSELAKKILTLNTKEIAQSIRFFYPYEVQVTDIKSHEQNTKGEASHQKYKQSQLESARMRLFKPLLDHLGIDSSAH